MQSFFTVLLQVGTMVVMMCVGLFLRKAGKFSDTTNNQLTWILINIITPSLIASSFLTVEPGEIQNSTLLLSVVLAFLSIGSGIILSWFLYRKEPLSRQRVLRFGTIFANTGYMGMPLVIAVLGDKGVIYASFYVASFNFLCWTYGYFIMSGEKKLPLKKILINPGTIGLSVGLPVYFFGFELPELFLTPILSFANMNTPVAMMILGAFIAQMKLKDFVQDKKVYAVVFFRLILIPSLVIGILLLFQPVDNLFISVVIQASGPAATNCVLFAAMFKSDVELSCKVVSVTTIFAIFTMPFMVSIAQFLVGITL